jgi:hypothetical protein
MSMFVWISIGTALWHFTIFVPDRFAGGIIGALLAANAGAIAVGFAGAGFAIPLHATIADAVIAGAGALAGLAVSYVRGSRGAAERAG